MADLIIKPSSGNSLVFQDEGGDAALTVGTTGISTIANVAITTGTIASAVTFPTGIIVQAVCNPTIVSNTTGHTSEAVAASVTSPITITSGNGVLIYIQASLYIDRGSNDMGFIARMRETTAASGAVISECKSRDSQTAGNWHEFCSLIGFDASPADTTPDYCLTLERAAAGANNVALAHHSAASASLKFMLFEIKQ